MKKYLVAIALFLTVFIPSNAFAVIAFDATGGQHSEAGDSSSKTWNHTITGSNTLLVVCSGADNSKTTNSVTYNGTSMTSIQSQTQGTQNLSIWYLLNPTAGTNTVQVNFSGSNWNWETTRSISYTGVLQSGQPDASAKNSSATDTVNQTITTVLANAMVVGCAFQNAGAGYNWTNLTERNESTGMSQADDIKVSAGALSVTAQNANSGTTLVLASFSPAPATVTLTSILGLVRAFWF